MPRMDVDTEVFQNGNFSFSGQKVGPNLGASEFTIVQLTVDETGSVAGFKTELEKCLGETVKACRKSPRADNLMLRTAAFNYRARELHGFKLLNNCNPDDYIDKLSPGGMTCLYDASVEGIDALSKYCEQMVKKEMDVNGLLVVITDGEDNYSKSTVSEVKAALANVVTDEKMESLVSILVGVNVTSKQMKQKLDDFHRDAGFTQFVALEDASDKTLAKLAQFISKSVSAQSQALKSGTSQSLVF